MGSRDDYCSISIITARACTEIRKRRSETCSLTTCISPRWIFSRWFETGEKNKGAQKVNQLQCGNTRNKSSKKKTNEENSLTEFDTKSSTALEDPVDAGGEKKAECMKLGIGFGLIYLFNATKNELKRMVEIRREMEILLHNSKMELQNNPSDASNLRTKISDCVEQFACSSESEITCSHDDCKGNERNLEMDQLEAELEVELERLQFQLDSDVMLKYSTQHDAESSGGGSHSASFTQVYNPDSCGVSAQELRRRLHELIQTRQEERIKKLELALESTMQQLAEKEKEVRWWRDTAKVISQHAPSRRSLTKLG